MPTAVLDHSDNECSKHLQHRHGVACSFDPFKSNSRLQNLRQKTCNKQNIIFPLLKSLAVCLKVFVKCGSLYQLRSLPN